MTFIRTTEWVVEAQKVELRGQGQRQILSSSFQLHLLALELQKSLASFFLTCFSMPVWRCSLRLSCDSTALLVARFCKVRADWMLASLKATSSICASSFPQLMLQMASLLCLVPNLFSFPSEIQQGRWGGSLR